jgi:cytochrome c-type biogenesis protein CcmH
MDMNRLMKTVLLGIITVAFFMVPVTCLAEALSLEDMLTVLRCPCGCNMVLEDCNCNTAKGMMNQIRQQISDGNSKDQIITEFQMMYGDIVLVTPPKSGLELIIWLLPIVTSVMGTIVIFENARGGEPFPTSEIKAPIAEVDVKIESEQIDAEIAKYEEMFYEEYKKFKEEEK